MELRLWSSRPKMANDQSGTKFADICLEHWLDIGKKKSGAKREEHQCNKYVQEVISDNDQLRMLEQYMPLTYAHSIASVVYYCLVTPISDPVGRQIDQYLRRSAPNRIVPVPVFRAKHSTTMHVNVRNKR
ncbi:hypothetical protein niasHT_029703 [Heterodera trifolii]|uniref:Uncharacterized protein n=1 Tax=Heterodera trifolii TaxID=157864 RepID=A0ABD2KIH4_9BILA